MGPRSGPASRPNTQTPSRTSLLAYLVFTLGTILYVSVSTAVPYFYSTLRTRVLETVQITPGSVDAHPFWRSTSRVEVRLYNITGGTMTHTHSHPRTENTSASSSKKLVVAQVGPYVFRKTVTKTSARFTSDGRMVSYRDDVRYVFVPEESVGSLSDVVTTVNVPLVGVLEAILSRFPDRSVQSRVLQYVASLVAGWREGDGGAMNGVYMTRGVGALLGGYEDGLLAFLGRVPGLKGLVGDARFGLLRNETAEHESAVWTGVGDDDDDEMRVGELHAWRGIREVEAYGGLPVRGTDGRQFAGRMVEGGVRGGKDRAYAVWVGDAFRAIDLRGTPRWDAGLGLETTRLVAGAAAFAPDQRTHQAFAGLFNITAPANRGRPGPPLFLSLPGFCGIEDDEVLGGVDGVVCDGDGDGDGDGDAGGSLDEISARHIHLDMEPLTGMVARARKSLMLSTHIGPRYNGAVGPSADPSIASIASIAPAFVPIMEGVETGSADAAQLQDLRRLQRVVRACALGGRVLPWVGGAMIVGGLVMILRSLSLGGEASEGDGDGDGDGDGERYGYARLRSDDDDDDDDDDRLEAALRWEEEEAREGETGS